VFLCETVLLRHRVAPRFTEIHRENGFSTRSLGIVLKMAFFPASLVILIATYLRQVHTVVGRTPITRGAYSTSTMISVCVGLLPVIS
jgi:hypothetical protein